MVQVLQIYTAKKKAAIRHHWKREVILFSRFFLVHYVNALIFFERFLSQILQENNDVADDKAVTIFCRIILAIKVKSHVSKKTKKVLLWYSYTIVILIPIEFFNTFPDFFLAFSLVNYD